MLIATFNTKFLEDDLKGRGFRHRPWQHGAHGTKIWSHPQFDLVIIVRGIEVPPGPFDPADIDKYFRKLQKSLERMRMDVSDLVFQGGGSIVVPGWFHDWCRLIKKPPIAIRIVNSNNAEEVAAAIGRHSRQY